MDNNIFGQMIMKKRKEIGITQGNLAEKLGVSFQAVSKWENGAAYPDIELLPKIAVILGTTVDAILGCTGIAMTDYEEYYNSEDYYWGLTPNDICYDIMKIKPPTKPYRVLDIGCGEGRDAVFLAKNGYAVTAYDAAGTGLKKARALAEKSGVYVDFFKGDIKDYRLTSNFDIVFSSGVFHYIPIELREEIFENIKDHINHGGLIAANVFVYKTYIGIAPDMEEKEILERPWYSGELFTHFHEWMFHKCEEIIFDCGSGETAHKHCMDILIAEKK